MEQEKGESQKLEYSIAHITDQASESLDEMTPEEERRIRRKIDFAIVPYCSLLYLLSFLDRVNIGQARLANLEKGLHLVGNQYDISLTIFFVSYVAFEIPSNLALRWLKPHRWITIIMVSWSIVMICMGLVHNFAGLAAARFMLGLAEGGLFPGINLLLSAYYNRNEQNLRISLFFAGATLAGAFGGILAFGIRHMAGVGGKDGWAWIFLLEGLLTFVCAIPAWWLVVDFPEDAKFLTEDERTKWLSRLLKNQGVTNAPVPFSMRQVKKAFTNWKTYVYALMYIGIAQPFYSLALFTPSIIKALGYTNANANLLSVPPYVLGFITTLLTAFASDKLKIRGPFLIGWMSLVVVGYIILISHVSVGVKYFAIFLTVAGVSPSIATAITWIANNFGPIYTRAAAMGFFFTIGNSAGLISSNVYPTHTAPRFIEGHAVAIGFAGMAIICAITLHISHKRENDRRDRVYGYVNPNGSDASPNNMSEENKAKWGLQGMSDIDIIELGDSHPAYRYIL
jgi:MFS family permease